MGFKALEDAIKDASQKYYTDGSSPVTDEQFDSMLDELKNRDPDNALLTQVGHGYDVDEYVMKTGKKKVKHKYGLIGSLDKAYNWSELSKELKHTLVDVSLKLDGISAVLYYENGCLYQALTRGVDGYGIDITDKVKYILQPSEQELEDSTFTGAVRGEIIMPEPRFKEYLEEVDCEAKNSRNTAAGLINSKDIEPDKLKYLTLPVYSIVGVESIQFEIDLRSNTIRETVDQVQDMREWLDNNFVCTAPYMCVCLCEDSYLSKLESIRDELNHDDYFPMDGLVLTAKLRTEGNQVIPTSQAFKFGAESGETTVTNVEWNLTKTRYLMPKINVEPLFLSGTNVENATGYNAQYIKENNIGVGTKLEISKHGEIIPNVDRIILATSAELPTTCPVCGTELVWSGVHLQCPNDLCGNAQIQDLLIWLQNLVPVDYLGDKLKLKWLSEFYQTSKLSIPKVMSGLQHIIDSVPRYDGVQPTTVMDMLISLYNKNFKLVDVIKALNIPRFGDVNAEKLAQYPELIQSAYSIRRNRAKGLSEERETSDVEYTASLMLLRDEYSKKIGEANMISLINHIYKLDNLKYIWDRIDFTQSVTDIVYKGKVAITGKLSVKRADFEKELRAHGYEAKEISKDTKFLITDDPNSSSSKNKKADQWGIVKISEEEFRRQYLS